MVRILLLGSGPASQHNPSCSAAGGRVVLPRRRTDVNDITTYNGALHCGSSTV